METIKAVELARQLGISRQRLYFLLKEGRIEGAVKEDGSWYIPGNARVIPAKRTSRRVTIVLWKPGNVPTKIRNLLGLTPKQYVILAKGKNWQREAWDVASAIFPSHSRILPDIVKWNYARWGVIVGE